MSRVEEGNIFFFFDTHIKTVSARARSYVSTRKLEYSEKYFDT